MTLVSLANPAFQLIQVLLVVAFTSEDASRDAEQSQGLRDQETALVKLGELYRDQKFVYELLNLTISS